MANKQKALDEGLIIDKRRNCYGKYKYKSKAGSA